MLAGSGGGNAATRSIVFQDAAPKATTRRVARGPVTPGPAASPTFVVDDVGQGHAAAGLVRPGEDRLVGRVAERQQVLAVMVLGIAEQPPRQVVFVDGRRDAADPELPGD